MVTFSSWKAHRSYRRAHQLAGFRGGSLTRAHSTRSGVFKTDGAVSLAAEGWDNAFVIKTDGAVSMDRSQGFLPTDSLAQNAEAIRAILVPAHDSETYLLWTNVAPFSHAGRM